MSTLVQPAQAQTWTGAASNDWFTAGNWTPAAIPTSAADASINTSTPGNQTVIGASGAAAKGLTLGALAGQTGLLDVTGPGALSIGADSLFVGDFGAGNLTIENGGNITITGGYTVFGNNAGSSGNGVITGAGSILKSDTVYIAADNAQGNLTISNGGNLVASSVIDLADFSALGTGTMTVTGAASRFTAGTMQIGTQGTGLLKMDSGAHGSVSFFTVLGSAAGSHGTAQIDGNGTVWSTGTLNVGDSGDATLQITNGALVQSGIVSFASSLGTGGGNATIDGASSKWTTGNFLVGSAGHGNVTVTNGAQIITTLSTAGPTASVGNGTFTVTGPGSLWEIGGTYTNGALYAGRAGGLGTINVLNGGNITIDATAPSNVALADLRLGLVSNGVGVLNIDGAGSSLTHPYNTYIGYAGNSTGTVTVSNGGALTTGYAVISLNPDATSATTDSVTVTGAGSLWTIKDTPSSDPTLAQGLTIGSAGIGVLTIRDGGTVTLANSASNVVLGGTSGSSGTLNIGAPNGNLAAAPGTLNAGHVIFATTTPGPLTVNFNHTSSNYVFAPQITGSGPGVVNILAGTTIFTADDTYHGATNISSGATLQLGAGGTTGSLTAGVANNGLLIFSRSNAITYAGVITGSGNVTQSGPGTVTLTGNSTYTGVTTIAAGSTLQLGSFSADGSIVGNVTDNGALIFLRTAPLIYGGVISGTGNVQKQNSGNLTLTGASTYTGGTTISGGHVILGASDRLPTAGALSISGGTTALDLNGFNQTVGNLTAPNGTIIIGAGTFTAGGSGNTSLGAQLTGSGGFVKQGSGTFNVTGTKSFTGNTTIAAGRMNVNGSMALSTFDVLGNATLGGNGTVGAATIEANGILAGAQGQTLTLSSLALNAAAKVNVTLGAPGTTALFAVTNDLTLDGTLNITSTGAFGAGLYRLMTYGGNLTDNGLDVGTVPTNVLASDIDVQTSVANQVNLIFSPSPTAFWNGSTLSATGSVVGGTGTWKLGPTNWTDSTGAISGAWNGGFAIFEAAPGVVTIDNSGGAITASGLQFAVDGYTLGGDVLTLADADPIIRVGDGTAGSAGYSATISAVIAGTDGLTKADFGTLVLAGANTYTGGTTVSGGNLSISADANLGDAAGNVTLAGGTLRVTAAFDSARNVDVAAASGVNVVSGVSYGIAGVLSGSGALNKSGAGTLKLDGSGPYSGLITVAAGGLQVDGALGGADVDVLSGALLGGTGTTGDATIESNGVLFGTQGQALSLGSLVLTSGAKVDVTLSAPGVAPLFAIAGNLTLDGTLDVTAPGAFGVGLYRVMTYGGTLTDNGLAIGSTPSGVAASNLDVQTSVAGQVNLIYDTGPLSFWNGSTLAPIGSVAGGTGAWSLGPTNWTNADGTASGAWDGDFAIFAGAPGTVTISNGGGAVSASGLQFAVNGYTVGGAALTLTGGSPDIRVGDGTPGGAAFSATISAPIAGTVGLDKTDLGALVLSGTNTYSGGTTITAGNLSVGANANLGDASGNVTLDGGTLRITSGFATSRAFDVASATGLNVATSATLNLGGAITGTGALTKSGAGALLVSAGGAYSGALSVAAGALEVDAALGAGTVDVQSGATLSGTGSVGGTTVESGGILVGTQGQTLSLGSLVLNSGAKVNVGLANPGTTPLFAVAGNLTLDGTLNVASTGAFGAGLYRIMTYGGGLTDNGLGIGGTPSGVAPSNLTVQTSVVGQVNLVYDTGPLSFWNGVVLSPTGSVAGGTGTWSLGPTNWTNANGSASGAWGGDFAIFSGAPGMVTISNGGGAVSASGLQFAVDGYTLGGASLTLTGASPIVRVGDGTLGGAADSATISAVIAGTGGLDKTDLGTLVLSATNTYTGGTTVSAGALSVAADANLGAAAGNVTLDGGALAATASFDTARTIDVASASGLSVVSGGTLGLTGALTGAGGLTKSGTGVLKVTGAGSYTGALTVAAGTLQADAALGSGSVEIQSGATLTGVGSVGATTIDSGGVLIGTQGQTLTLSSLSLVSGAKVNVGLATPGTTPLFAVTNNLTLDGTLNVASTGAFGEGLYRVMTYGGGLTDNGLDVGSTPSGVTPTDLVVQTSVAGQVNLVFTPSPLPFWNGSTVSPAGSVVGGVGTWSVGPSNWTNAAGTISGAWDGGFAIFAGAPGSVSVNNGGGAVSASGLQFAVNGYTVGGAALTLTGASPTIRVGDGTPGGAAFSATISAPIAGTGGLGKTDLGTLVLSGINTYTGGTTISAGALSVAANANLGDAGGTVTLDGGTLRATAGFASGRTFDVNSASGLDVAPASTLNVTGAITGAGALTKTGTGKLQVSAASAYSGALTVSGGALEVDAALGATTVSVQSGSTLSGTGSIAGSVTVAGGATLIGVQGQTLTMGALSLAAGSATNVTLGAPSNTALFAVTHDLTLDGTLNVTGAVGFGEGVYRVMTYGGALTDDGLDIGAVASGTSAANYAVQTAVAGQVNLVYALPVGPVGPFLFWDGDGAGRANNGAVDGGSGTWTTTSTNFTDVGGAANGPMTPQPGFAIFEGAPGTVTVDDTGGQVSVTGMQFASTGYVVTGDAVDLANADTQIRVGDGTAQGAAYTATIASALTGTGGLEKTDLGTLVLTGADTYAGGTIVTGGVLSGSAMSFGAGAITDNAALVIDQAADASFANAISGGGALTKAGAGSLNLTGSNAFSGATTVAAGRLAVNGSLAHSIVTVASGATLGGNGVVGGVVAQAGGTVAPGNSIGVLTVAGNSVQAAGSTYQVELDAAGHADRLAVSGATTIAGGATLNVVKTDADPYVLGTRYTVLTADGGVSGTYGLTGATTSLTPFIGLVADYGANDVYLDVTKTRTFASAGATPNQIAAGAAADDLPLANIVANTLANLPTIAAADAAFDQLSGEIHASARGAMLDDGRAARDGVLDHLAGLDGIRDRQTGLWAQAVVGSRRFYGDGNAATAHGGDTAILAGFDHGFGRVVLGVFGGYQESNLDVDARSSAAKLQGWHVGGYGQVDLGAGFAVRGGGDYGGWSADIDRGVLVAGLADRLHSHDRADEAQAFGEISWTTHLGPVRVQPFAGVGWSRLGGAGFVERGGVAALDGQGLAEDVGSGKVGVRVDGTWVTGGFTVRPHASLAWEAAFDGRSPLAAVSFVSSPASGAYVVAGPRFARSRGDVDLGVDVGRGGFTIGAGYTGEFSSRAQQSGFKAHADWNF